MSKILVPVDGSACSRKAAEYAAALSKQEGALTLLHAISPVVSERVVHYIGRDRVEQIQREDADAQLAELMNSVKKADVPHELHYEFSIIHDAIVKYARQNHHLVVMGTHGYGKITGMLMGSVSYPVIAELQVPVILVPEAAEVKAPKTIIVAVDGSEHAKKAAEKAIELGSKQDAHFILVTVVTPPMFYTGIDAQGMIWQDQQELAKIGEEVLAGYEHLFIEKQVPYTSKVLLGDPAVQIKELAEETNTDL
ncbi:MAG: universal stress protein, partial [Clostridia bacterium]